jgi:hypothetical protein
VGWNAIYDAQGTNVDYMTINMQMESLGSFPHCSQNPILIRLPGYIPTISAALVPRKGTHLTDLETVLLCFLISELPLLSREGLSTSLADPPLLELGDILFSMTIEMEVKPGSVFCRSRSGLGDLTINLGVGEIRRNNSGIRPLGSLDAGTGGGGIDRPEVVEGIEVLDDPRLPAGMDGLLVDDPRGSR